MSTALVFAVVAAGLAIALLLVVVRQAERERGRAAARRESLARADQPALGLDDEIVERRRRFERTGELTPPVSRELDPRRFR